MMLTEKVGDNVSWIGMAFIVGYITCAAMNHTAVIPWLWQQRAVAVQDQKVLIPKLAAEANCEHKRADTASALAVQPEQVDPSELPQDCPHVSLSVPPKKQPIPK